MLVVDWLFWRYILEVNLVVRTTETYNTLRQYHRVSQEQYKEHYVHVRNKYHADEKNDEGGGPFWFCTLLGARPHCLGIHHTPHHHHTSRAMMKPYHLAFLLLESVGVKGFLSPSIGHVAGSSKLHMNLDFSACPVNSRESLQRTTDLSLEGIGARKVALLGSTVRPTKVHSPSI